MPGVQHVEATVGERDALPGLPAAVEIGEQVRQADDLARAGNALGRAERRVQEVGEDFVARDGGDADLLDFESAGDVREPNRRVVVGTGGEREPERGHHHVAGAGDVVHLPRPRGKDRGTAIAMRERHAVLVERDDAGFEFEAVAQFGRGRECLLVRRDGATGREARFEPVRRHRWNSRDTSRSRRRASGRRSPSHRGRALPRSTSASSAGVQTPLS